MITTLLAIDVCVKCFDGTEYDDAQLWVLNGKRIYRSKEGQNLQVETVKSAKIIGEPFAYFEACHQFPLEEY